MLQQLLSMIFSCSATASALIGLLCVMLVPANVCSKIKFKEVTEEAGLYRWGDSFGASWGDFNQDGWPDLWIGNHCEIPGLYRNNGDGTFSNVIELVRNYDGFEQHGAAWADFDNDGDQDLIQIVGGDRQKSRRANQLFVNNNGQLINEALKYNLAYDLGRGRTPLWCDLNSDGYLDLIVSNLNRSDDQYAPSVLFTQHKDNFIIDPSFNIKGGISAEFAQLYISSIIGDPVVLIQGKPYPLIIYKYYKMPFGSISRLEGFPEIKADVSDTVIADFNNDLQNDLFLVTAQWAEPADDRIIIKSGTGFRDITSLSGIDSLTTCWSAVSADFDNDMDMDLYLVCSHIHCNQPNVLYENMGNNRFRKVDAAGGAMGSSYGKGDSVTTVDYNNDGFIDLYVTNKRDAYDEENSHNHLFQNAGNRNHWIEIDLVGDISNRDGIGSVLILTAGGKEQMRIQDGGIHRVSQNHQRIHFGLGSNNEVDKLTIKWPSGIVQELYNIRANQIIKIFEQD